MLEVKNNFLFLKNHVALLLCISVYCLMVACLHERDEVIKDTSIQFQREVSSTATVTQIPEYKSPVTINNHSDQTDDHISPKHPMISAKEFPLEAEVVQVISGNEILVRPLGKDFEIKIQYLGVSVDSDQFGAESSKDFNGFITKNCTVNISEKDLFFDAKREIYGAYVFCDGEFINKVILSAGFGQFGEFDSVISRKSELLSAQEDAMKRGLGLWEGFIKGNQNTCGTLPCAKR